MQYQIGDFSKITRLTIKTLRYYDELGLLKPVNKSEESGYRYYDETCLETARMIQTLKEMDFSLKDIKEILDNYTDDSEIVEYMVKKANELKQKIAHYSEMQKKVETFVAKERDLTMTNLPNDLVIKNVPDILAASIRFKGKYSDFSKYVGKIYKHCGRYSSGAPFSLYYDTDYKEDDADIEVCVPVKTEVNKDEVKTRKISGGQALTIIHKGPYETIGDSYKILIDHVNKHNLKVKTPSREIYLKGPGMIFRGNPKKYLTEIQMILEQG